MMSLVYNTEALREELYNYDVYPMVFLTGEKRTITVHPLGTQYAFSAEKPLYLRVMNVERAEDSRYPGSGACLDAEIEINPLGDLLVTADFLTEGRYYIAIFEDETYNNKKMKAQLWIYALDHDMKGRYPLRGDLHMHTCRSDGKDDPNNVAANYRAHGLDFMVISDHHRYYPSLEARKALRIGLDDQSDLTDFLVVPGEEIHLPLNDAHYVNFGGRYSINALITPSRNAEPGEGTEFRSLTGECPETMTREAFEAMIQEKASAYENPILSERLSLAVLDWIYEQVQKAGGLGIFPHPFWLYKTMQLSEDFTRCVYEHQPFDAFEVLGGESYYQHNGLQTVFYYEMKAKGINPPVVGSTDSHRSTPLNRNYNICSTIVFAPANTTEELISSIKDHYSVAVDSISPEYRLVGDYRWIKFGSFLMENWYPLHNRAAAAEGYYLKQYLTGADPMAEKVLLSMKGQIPAMFRKYFDMN